MEDIILPFKKGRMHDIDLGEPSSSQPEQDKATLMEVDEDSLSSQVSKPTAKATILQNSQVQPQLKQQYYRTVRYNHS